MRVPELIAATCVSLGFQVPERRSSKVAAFGLDVVFAAGVEILTSSPSVGTLDWRGPLTNIRFTLKADIETQSRDVRFVRKADIEPPVRPTIDE
jgi:hypothetical protein